MGKQVKILEYQPEITMKLLQFLFGNIYGIPRIALLRLADRLPQIGQTSAVHFLQQSGAPQKRRLSRTGRPYDGYHFPLFHCQGNILQNLQLIKRLPHMFYFQ